MSMRSYLNFLERVDKDPKILKTRLYHLTGEDKFLQEDILEVMRERLRLKVHRYNNLIPQFFSMPNAILVFPPAGLKKWKPDDLLKLDRYVVIYGDDDEWELAVKEKGLVINCKPAPPYGENLDRQVQAMCTTKHIEISKEGLDEIKEKIGSSSFKLVSTIQMLSHWKENVSVKDLQRVLAYDREDEVFELVNLIAFGKTGKALVVLKGMLDLKKEGLIVDWLLNFFEKMWVMYGVPPQNRNEEYLSQILAMGSHWVRRYRYLEKFYNKDQVYSSYMMVLNAYDELRKNRDAGIVLTGLVMTLGEKGR